MMKLKEAIDVIFSHNELVALWKSEDKDHDIKIWSGMAHQLPDIYLEKSAWMIFGLIPEKISEADYINIRLGEETDERG